MRYTWLPAMVGCCSKGCQDESELISVHAFSICILQTPQIFLWILPFWFPYEF